MSDVREGVVEILRDVLDRPELEVQDHQSAHDVEGWDSLAHLSILFSLEDRFGVRFTDGEMGSIQNVGELISLISAKTGATR
jgi:acyl carrier protein